MSVSSTSGSAATSSYEWDARSVYEPDATSYEQHTQYLPDSSYEQETQLEYEADVSSHQPDSSGTPESQGVIGRVIGGTTYYNGLPPWYSSTDNSSSGSGRTTRSSDGDDAPLETAPQPSQAAVQQAHAREQLHDTSQMELVGLQVADTAVEIPRLHGAVWGHPTLLTGVGPVEHDEKYVLTIPYLVPTPQSVWLTNRRLPNGPDTDSASGERQTASDNLRYLEFTPTENEPIATYPVKITNVEGKPDVLHLPIMPQLLLHNMPGEKSAVIFHHVAWLFWPARVPDPSSHSCLQRMQVAQRYMN